MRRQLAAFALAGAIVAGCTGDENLASNDIVSEIPWTVPETTGYVVFDDDGDEVGTLEMSIEADDDGLMLRQQFDFPDAGFINDAVVFVDPSSLQPRSTEFNIEGPEGNLACEAVYEEGRVVVHRVGEDEERTDELDVPRLAYDSWSDLFVWRTIAFAEGYDVEYTDILSCTLDRTQRLNVKLEVKEQEEVTVPAGTFETQRLEITSGGRTQKAWFSTDDERLVVRYDNGREVFELTEPPDRQRMGSE